MFVEKLMNALEVFASKPKMLLVAGTLSIGFIFLQVNVDLFGTYGPHRIIDSYSYYFAAKAINEGINPYDWDTIKEMGVEAGVQSNEGIVCAYIYPPLLAGVWRIFTPLSHVGAHRAFIYLNTFLIGLSLYLVYKVVHPKRHPHALMLLYVLVQGLNGHAVSNIHIGQTNIILMVLILASLYLHIQGKQAWSALPLVAAIIIKITPGILLLYFAFLYKGRRLQYLGWVLFWFLVLTGLSCILAPPIDWVHYFQFMKAQYLQPTPLNHSEYSIWGWLYYRSWNSQFFAQYMVLLYFMITLPLLAMTLFSIRNTHDNERPVYAFSQLIMLSLLFSPVTWQQHYYIYLLPGYYFVVYNWGENRRFMTLLYSILSLGVIIRSPNYFVLMMRPAGTLLATIFGFRLKQKKQPTEAVAAEFI